MRAPQQRQIASAVQAALERLGTFDREPRRFDYWNAGCSADATKSKRAGSSVVASYQKSSTP